VFSKRLILPPKYTREAVIQKSTVFFLTFQINFMFTFTKSGEGFHTSPVSSRILFCALKLYLSLLEFSSHCSFYPSSLATQSACTSIRYVSLRLGFGPWPYFSINYSNTICRLYGISFVKASVHQKA
jgi:hypothetical protein